MSNWPKVVYKEEGMREGMQIESAAIPVVDKVRLLDALSDTGLKYIVVGSFVSPRYTPQMARIEEIVEKFTPRPGVTYLALTMNARGVERAQKYVPPLTLDADVPRLFCHMCDVFIRRNGNRPQQKEIEEWPSIAHDAASAGQTHVGIGANAAWGSNFLGQFDISWLMTMLEKQQSVWHGVGLSADSVLLGDPMSWCHPLRVEETLTRIKQKWPGIHDYRLHLHNARNLALPSMYAALRALESTDTLVIDGTIGGFGGCPYCGNGQVTGMAPTEDVVHMLKGMDIDLGVDLDRIIDTVWMCEEIVGRSLFGRVSKAGPWPRTKAELYDPNMPFVETEAQARHFRMGPSAYEGGIYPWKEKIASAFRARVEADLPAFEDDGGWPWTESHFKPASSRDVEPQGIC